MSARLPARAAALRQRGRWPAAAFAVPFLVRRAFLAGALFAFAADLLMAKSSRFLPFLISINAFRTIALVIVIMAMSIGLYELATARTLRGHLIDEWLLGAAGVVSVGFAVAFLAFVLRWIKLDPSPSAQTFYWLGSYFGFTAICMVGLALHLNGRRVHIDRVSSRKLQTG